MDAATLRLACQGGEERWRTSRAAVARGERAGCAEHRTGEATYARGRKCENALELRGKRAPAEFPGQAIARESTLAKGDGVMGALGCTQRTRGRRRVGSALEWQRGEKTRERARERRESDESDNAVEGSEEYFDESEHVDGFAAEERSSDGEEVE